MASRPFARRRLWLFLAILGTVMGAAVVAAWLTSPQYSAIATLRVKERPLPIQGDMRLELTAMKAPAVAAAVAATWGLLDDPEFASPDADQNEDVVAATQALIHHTHVRRRGRSRIVELSVRSADPIKAQRLANAMAMAYVAGSQRAQFAQAAERDPLGPTGHDAAPYAMVGAPRGEIIAQAALPLEPSFPKWRTFATVGFLLGVAAGATVIFLIQLFDIEASATAFVPRAPGPALAGGGGLLYRQPAPASAAPLLGGLGNLLKPGADRNAEEAVPAAGAVIYAVGDIHGRSDLLDRLMEQIRADAAQTTPAQPPVLVFVGDYIDRGPDSRGVIDRMIALKADPAFSVVTLRGNHEQFLLDFLDSEGQTNIEPWLQFGGIDTLRSYGVQPPDRGLGEAWIEGAQALARALPLAHRAFLDDTILTYESGSYVFVHAGVRPGEPLENQTAEDLTQIRRVFLKAKEPLKGRIVVYGHTVTDEPNVEPWKIGIDTGAYASSRLTALRIEDRKRTFIST